MRSIQVPLSLIENRLHVLDDDATLDHLIESIGNSRIVMLGEASHGTHEYYTLRARISRRLIAEKGFNFIAVEGDWPPCYKVNRFVKGYSNGGDDAIEVLKGFNRWPGWMWANWEISAFITWLRAYNPSIEIQQRCGFYGLDVYSLWESMEEIIRYLEREDPNAAKEARRSVQCFDPYKNDEQQYAWATRYIPTSCEKEVLALLETILTRSAEYNTDPEVVFNTEQNALVTVNAEKYYREMVKSGPGSWNVRDNHMMKTLERLLEYHGVNSKAIIWAHNTHIGDARFTDMKSAGMINIGQLAREKFGRNDVSLVGFGSYQGKLIAGEAWDAPCQIMEMPEASPDSWEGLLSKVGTDNFFLLSHDFKDTSLEPVILDHRAIGVVYNPAREPYGNYVPSKVMERYDAFVFIRNTQALHPVGIPDTEHSAPDLYPWNF